MFRERGTHARPHPLDGFFLVRRDRPLDRRRPDARVDPRGVDERPVGERIGVPLT